MVLPEKLTVTELVKKFLAFYGAWRFINVFTRACQWYQSSARCIQSNLPPCFLKMHRETKSSEKNFPELPTFLYTF